MKFFIRNCISLNFVVLLLFSQSNTVAIGAENARVLESSPMVGSVQGYQIWRGSVPTKVSIPVSYAGATKPCGYLLFQIEALAPQADLLNRATGIDVDFEIWSNAGAKIGSSSLSSYSWNPVNSNNQVKIFICDESSYGTHTLLISNKRTLSTTGLLSRYLEEKTSSTISIEKPLPAPSAPGPLKAVISNGVIKYSFKPASGAVTEYEVLIANSLPGVKAAKSTVYDYQFGQFEIAKRITNKSFTLSKKEILGVFPNLNSMILTKVRAVGVGGEGPVSYGIFTSNSSIKRLK
jgi:hypothetical protein